MIITLSIILIALLFIHQSGKALLSLAERERRKGWQGALTITPTKIMNKNKNLWWIFGLAASASLALMVITCEFHTGPSPIIHPMMLAILFFVASTATFPEEQT